MQCLAETPLPAPTLYCESMDLNFQRTSGPLCHTFLTALPSFEELTLPLCCSSCIQTQCCHGLYIICFLQVVNRAGTPFYLALHFQHMDLFLEQSNYSIKKILSKCMYLKASLPPLCVHSYLNLGQYLKSKNFVIKLYQKPVILKND